MTAPSFSSFPSFSTFPDLESQAPPTQRESRTSEKSSRDKSKKDRKRRDRSKDREHKDKEHRSSKSHRHREDKKHERRTREEASSTPREERLEHASSSASTSQTKNHFFYSDRKGDASNIQYGSLHKGDIPRYRMVAGGRSILGLPVSFIAFRRGGRGIEIGLKTGGSKASSLTDSAARALLSKPPTRRIGASNDTNKYQAIDGIISLQSRRGVDVARAEDTYRSITTGFDEQGNSDSDAGSASGEGDGEASDEDDDQPILTAHQESLKQLEAALQLNPEDISTWLSLLKQSLSVIPPNSKNAAQARSEITASIISRALSASPRNSSNKRLRLLYLKAGADIWHESKLRAEWDDALKIGGIEIQMEWLERMLATSDIEGIVESAGAILRGFGVDQDSEIAKVRVFWRVATGIRDAGYTERAMALFQAQAEVTFNLPSKLSKMSLAAQLDELEEFWDSEVPRLGETGAKGWASWYASRGDQSDAHPTQPTPTTANTRVELDPYREWARQESIAHHNGTLPQRSDSDTSDPYSIVMFGDLRSLLTTVTSQKAKEALRLAWLSFLGLHVPGVSLASSDSDSEEMNWDDRWNLSNLAKPSSLNAIFPSDAGKSKLLTDSVAGVIIGREQEYASSFGPVRSFGPNVVGPLDMIFAGAKGSPYMCMWAPADVQNVDERIVRNLFSSLSLGPDDYSWKTLALAFEAALNVKTALKLSKSFLSLHPHATPLWTAHAQLERLRGHLDDARKVYQTILISNKSAQPRSDIGAMWWCWAEMEWLSGQTQTALNVIVKSAGVEGGPSGITFLRSKRALEDLVNFSASLDEKKSWVKLRALLELLTDGEPGQVTAIFDRYIELESFRPLKESLITSALLMIYYHSVVLKRPIPPAILRERAYSAFEEYPSNSIILGVVLEAEKGQGVWGRLRGMLGANGDSEKDVSRRVEEVWLAGWEKHRWFTEIERTRNGLSVAAEQTRTKGSPVLWRVYLEFEIRTGNLRNAKKLLFRAIGECPLVKELYLLAFGPLRSVFQAHELSALADTMVERNIRLHHGLDEFVTDPVDNGNGAGSRSDEDDIDEIEENAQELRRLMPY